jgi:hypothetical protein
MNKLSMLVHVYNTSYIGGRGRRITVWGQPRQKHETSSEKKNKKLQAKGLGVWLEC